MLSRLRLRKIGRDLWLHKTRTILAVLTIAIGVFAVGTISRTWMLLSRELAVGYASVNPASAILFTNSQFHDNLVEAVNKMADVTEAEGKYATKVQIQVAPDQWRLINLIVLADYNDLRIDQVRSEQGEWPPSEHTMLLERSSLTLVSTQSNALSQPNTTSSEVIGKTFLIEMPNGKQREIAVSGVAHDLTQIPTPFSGSAYGYITPKTLERLTGSRGYGQLHIVIAEGKSDEHHAQQIVTQVKKKVEDHGLEVTTTQILDPTEHPLGDISKSMLLILVALAPLSLSLSALLVINITSALLARQIPQIGTMKAVGASRNTIITLYIGMILLFGLFALTVSVPTSQLAAHRLTLFLAGLLNFNITTFHTPPYLYTLDIFAGLIVPLAAALIPIRNGSRVTVNEAISYGGIWHNRFETTSFNQFLTRTRGISTPLRYAGRNIFRHKTRLTLTLVAFTLAGTIFMSVMSVRASLLLTIDDVAAYWQQDIKFFLQSAQRIMKIEQAALSIPGVVSTEGRLVKKSVVRLRTDGTQSPRPIILFGVPATTNFTKPTILEGRWLQAEDHNSIVINIDLLKEETDLSVGDEITLKLGEREITWQVVGLVTGQVIGGGGLMAPMAYVNYHYLAKVTGEVGHATEFLIETEQHDNQFQAEIAKKLAHRFKELGVPVLLTELNSDVRTSFENVIGILVALMLVMTILLATVGGLGLMGTMTLNVLERTQELGIVRILGASDSMVAQIVIIEGVFIGILSWMFGAFLAVPLSKFLSYMVGINLLNIPLTYTFPFSGILLWLLIAIVLSALASFLPARNATQLTVREALAYE